MPKKLLTGEPLPQEDPGFQRIGPSGPDPNNPDSPHAPLLPGTETNFKSSDALEMDTLVNIREHGGVDTRKPEMGMWEEIKKTAATTTTQTLNERLPWSDVYSADEWDANIDEMHKLLLDPTNTNKPPDNLVNYLMEGNQYEELAYLLREKFGYSAIKLKEETDVERATRLTGARKEHAKFMSGTSWVGKTTEFLVGGVEEMAMNPYYWPGMAFGATQYVYGSRALAALAMGGMEAGGEVVNAFDTYDYKREIGMNYNSGVAATEVAIAFGFGAVGAVPVGELTKRIMGKLSVAEKTGKLTPALKAQTEDLVAVLESGAKSGETDAKVILTKLDNADAKINQDKVLPERSINEDDLADEITEDAIGGLDADPAKRKEVAEPEDNPEINAELDEKIKNETKSDELVAAEAELTHMEKCAGSEGSVTPSAKGVVPDAPTITMPRVPTKAQKKRAARKATRRAKKTKSDIESAEPQPQILPTQTGLTPKDIKADRQAFQQEI